MTGRQNAWHAYAARRGDGPLPWHGRGDRRAWGRLARLAPPPPTPPTLE